MTNTTVVADSADVEQNKVMAILAYIIFLIPLLAAPDSAFARYHTNQGLWLLILAIILNTIGFVTICLLPVTMIIWVVYIVLGIVNASQGKMQPLPGFASLPVLIK
jgi:uncharacterized membrane protein